MTSASTANQAGPAQHSAGIISPERPVDQTRLAVNRALTATLRSAAQERFRPVSPLRHCTPRASHSNGSPSEAGSGPYGFPVGAAGSRTSGTDGHLCGLFSVDIAGFTHPRRDEHIQLHLREMLYRILERAFDGSGMPWRSCHHEDRGDGSLIIVPPAIPVDGLADPLPERLCGLVRVHNRLSSEEARIQLRAAAHIGRVYRDDHGIAGDAASHLYRLLEAPRLKRLLATSGNELAFITSDYFYDTVIRRHPTLVDPAAFQPLTIDMRHATATGWVQLIGSAAPSARILRIARTA